MSKAFLDHIKAVFADHGNLTRPEARSLFGLLNESTIRLMKAEAILRRLVETEDLDELIIIANEAARYFEVEEKSHEK